MSGGHPEGLLAYTWPGIDTTVRALSSAVLEFATHPDQWDLLRADPSLVPAAFNEVLRLHTPVKTFARVTTRSVTVGDTDLPAGARVAVMFGSANRDERRYGDPNRFDITRNPTDAPARPSPPWVRYRLSPCPWRRRAREVPRSRT